ncbi:MAG: hypothetical protein ACI9F9_000563 [Candidatus Paceibacteria bacterium]|jgi:hypothetical protein
MKNETKPTHDQAPQKKASGTRTEDASNSIADKTRGLDFSKLDLTVDRVDERLSPSETNIFDK